MSGADQSVKSKKNRKRLLWAAALGIGLLCFAGIWLLDRALVSAQFFPFLQLQGSIYDRGMTYYAISGRHPQLPVCVLSVGDKTRQDLTPPVPSFVPGVSRQIGYRHDSRAFHAQVVRNLKKLGAKVVVFDMLFDEEDREFDKFLDAAIKDHGKVVLAAADETSFKNDRQAEELHSLQPPNPVLREHAAGYGAANLPPDPDRTLRRFDWWFTAIDEDTTESVRLPTLAVLAAAVFSGVDPRAEINNVEGRGVFLGKPIVGFRGKIGEDPVFVSFIRFFGPAGSPAGNRSVANYEDVFNLDNPAHPQSPADREALRKQIEGKIVVIGDTSPAGQDVHRSPVWTQGSVLGGNEMPGVEIQAHAIQTVLSGLYVRQASDVAHTLLLLALCLVMAVVTRVLTPLPAAAVGILSLGVLYLGSVWLLSAHSYWMEPVTASAGIVVTTLAGTAVMYSIEHRERMATRRQLDRHLGPGVAQALNEDEFPELGGESVEITLLFSDLQGFTSLSEKMDSKGMCGLLNRYFGDVIFPVLFAHGGTLDKMMGDGMMAYFGWIPKQPDHARRAALCALEMERALDAWLKLPENANLPPLRTRIGVHTGVATVGEIGAGSRAQFTVIGDVVNVAARLEAMNKEFGSVVLISDATRTQAGDLGVKFTERGVVQVRGRAEPLPVFSAHLEDIVGANGGSPEQGGSGSSSKVEAAGAGEKQ